MSSFLAHLAQRTLTDRPAVRPRPVGLYEPAPPEPASGKLQPATVETAEDFARDERAAREMRVDVPRAAASREGAPRDPVSGRMETQVPAEAVHRTRLHRDPHVEPIGEQPGQHPGSRSAAPRARNDQAAAEAAARSEGSSTAREQPALSVELRPVRPWTARDAAAEAGELAPPRRALEARPLEEAMEFEAFASSRVSAPAQVRARGTPGPREPGTDPDGASASHMLLTKPIRAVRAAPEEPQDGPDAARHGGNPRVSFLSQRGDSQRGAPRASAQGALTPRLPRRDRLALPAQPFKAAEPVISVTIDRVEIRAVSAPQVKASARPSKPALSLSDYLDRRSGGRR